MKGTLIQVVRGRKSRCAEEQHWSAEYRNKHSLSHYDCDCDYDYYTPKLWQYP